jgi:hypothetical protein
MAMNRIDFKQHVEERLAQMKAERARSRQLMEEEQKEVDVSKRVEQEEKAQDVVERQIILESTRAPNVGGVPSLTYNIAGLRAKKRKREGKNSILKKKICRLLNILTFRQRRLLPSTVTNEIPVYY